MSSLIRIKASARRSLGAIPRSGRERIVARIHRLPDTPGAGGVFKGELRGLRRLRVSGYRIVWEQGDDDVLILVVRPTRG
jgi:mRNA-degrading endonuclease RelE of RelBE toxin-antitoxin system